ncbi:class II D-tagatose-bisphosphate aldolase, non-catalytic subunit [Novacetimonas pomaceti]|uniref:Tagatose-bisphosphate aldolase n=1 Tax=Novacetimonas pomaceti TaxID=2021998 RepID=A0ABX5P3A9_9PROT|nr:class II D-tagatose-bisphosphate aldolase, non-catalytic subunit [Novacetimonas pomaceti]PYD48200.1 tagatose-bisphosphate aldolase [Novacetimonas pomaceti]
MTTAATPLLMLARQIHDQTVPARRRRGITSVCSAHPLVLEAALSRTARTRHPVLIEATCNQVNQEGGYTGMTPAAFRDMVYDIARRVDCPRERILLGGDHLGPNPWKSLPAEEAMERAQAMIAAYAEAGFVKLHLDASMGCRGEAAALPDAVVARRACTLAARAEAARPGQAAYVIGTEVPVPGGVADSLDHLCPTSPTAALQTLHIHEEIFTTTLGQDVWERVIALVVQPGVEFGVEDVAFYRRERARDLIDTLSHMPGRVFEAHSTDYQPLPALRALVEDGFAILKVGPGLTFALREALYALDDIRAVLRPERTTLRSTMERLMRDNPAFWQGHYAGSARHIEWLRHYSYSDRIRYYWALPQAQAAVGSLFDDLGETGLPDPLISQFLPALYEDIRTGSIPRNPRIIAITAVETVLNIYDHACHGNRISA